MKLKSASWWSYIRRLLISWQKDFYWIHSVVLYSNPLDNHLGQASFWHTGFSRIKISWKKKKRKLTRFSGDFLLYTCMYYITERGMRESRRFIAKVTLIQYDSSQPTREKQKSRKTKTKTKDVCWSSPAHAINLLCYVKVISYINIVIQEKEKREYCSQGLSSVYIENDDKG